MEKTIMTIAFSGGISLPGIIKMGPAPPAPPPEIIPPNASNLVLWLDAADQSTITLVDDEVDIWADKDTSTEANDFTAESPNVRPGYNLIEQNSLPGVDFSMASNVALRDDVISNTELDNLFNGGGYLICVLKGGNATSGGKEIFRKNFGWILLAKDAPSGNFTKWQMHNTFTTSGSIHKMANFDAPIDTAFILEVQYTRSTTNTPILRINGVSSTMDEISGGNGSPKDDSVNPINIGNSWDGSIYEVLLYNSIPNGTDQTSLRDQLTTKWGL